MDVQLSPSLPVLGGSILILFRALMFGKMPEGFVALRTVIGSSVNRSSPEYGKHDYYGNEKSICSRNVMTVYFA